MEKYLPFDGIETCRNGVVRSQCLPVDRISYELNMCRTKDFSQSKTDVFDIGGKKTILLRTTNRFIH